MIRLRQSLAAVTQAELRQFSVDRSISSGRNCYRRRDLHEASVDQTQEFDELHA